MRGKSFRRSAIILFCAALLLIGAGAAGCREKNGTPEEWVEKTQAKDVEPLAAAQNRFALDLWSEIRRIEEKTENIFISPTSIHTAFLMAFAGMGGETGEEAKRVLGIETLEDGKINPLARALRRFLESSDQVTFESANALFLKENFPFRPEYNETVELYFDAEVGPMPATTDPINRWVEEKTHGLIEGILEPESPISPDVIAYLLNAVYFYGNWAVEFDPDNTRDDTFTNREGLEKEVRMMEKTEEYAYFEKEGLQAVALPYRDENYRMLVFLPGTLDGFEERFTLEMIDEIRKNLRSREVRLQMPRFRMEYETTLNEALGNAGMNLAFNPREADFSRMVELEKLGGENVYISEARHKAFVEVDEEGTEAAAVTSIEMRVTAMPPPPELMRLDRPFYFLVEEKETGAILFIGRAADL